MHSPPRYPRPSTPLPTVPPPSPEVVARRLEPWKALVGIGVALLAAGAAWATWKSTLATQDDLAHVRTAVAATVSSQAAGAAAQMGALQAKTQELGERAARLEASINAMASDMTFLRDQLIEVAKVTGAHRVEP